MAAGELMGLTELTSAVLDVPLDPAQYREPTLHPNTALLPVQAYAERLVDQTIRGMQLDGQLPDAERIARLHAHLGDDIALLRRHVRVAENLAYVEDGLSAGVYDDPREQTRAEYQYHVTRRVLRDLQMVRVPGRGPLPPPREALQAGVLVVAPTGFGKTHVAATLLAASGVGHRLHPSDSEPFGGMVVVPTLDLLHQYASDNPDNHFRRIIGFDVPIATYYGDSKETAPLTIITSNSLKTALKEGTVRPDQFGITVFDEAHHNTAPGMYEAMQQVSGSMVLLTATPAYSARRDVRRFFPHIEVGSLREFTENGVLNPARILTFRAEAGERGAERVAADLALHYLEAGRRILIYTNSGNQSEMAIRVAQDINERVGRVVAAGIRSVESSKAQEDIAAFRAGTLSVLATCAMLQEGSNVAADTMISIGPHFSEVGLAQRVGRVMRPTDKDSILAEIWPHDMPKKPMATIASLFGIEAYRQGMRIAPQTIPKEPSHEYKEPRVRPLHSPPPESDLDLPPELSRSLLPPQEVRSYFISPELSEVEGTPPEGYLSTSDLALLYNTTELHIEMALEAKDVFMVTMPMRGAKKRFSQWYHPDALRILTENPPIGIREEGALTVPEVARYLEISKEVLSELCAKKALEPRVMLIEGGKAARCLDNQMLDELMKAIETLPEATAEDVPLNVLVELTDIKFVQRYEKYAGLAQEIMRRHEAHGIAGVTFHVSAESAGALLQTFESRKEVDGLTSVEQVAQRAYRHSDAIYEHLSPEERSAIVLRTPRTSKDLGPYFPSDVADAIVERLGLKELPPGLISRAAVGLRFAESQTTLARKLGKATVVNARYRGQQQDTAYIDWEAAEAAERSMTLRPGAGYIDYRRLRHQALAQPSNELYAHVVQATLMPWFERDTWHSPQEALSALQCSTAALRAVLEHRRPERSNGARRVNGELQLSFNTLRQMHAVFSAARQLLYPGWIAATEVDVRAKEMRRDPASVLRNLPKFDSTRDDVRIGYANAEQRLVDVFYSQLLFRRAAGKSDRLRA